MPTIEPAHAHQDFARA